MSGAMLSARDDNQAARLALLRATYRRRPKSPTNRCPWCDKLCVRRFCGHACAGSWHAMRRYAEMRRHVIKAAQVSAQRRTERLAAYIREKVPDLDPLKIYRWAWDNGYRQGQKVRRRREEAQC